MAMRHLKKNPLWALALVAALGMGLTACGGSDDDPAPATGADDMSMDPMEPEAAEPTPIEKATTAVGVAEASVTALGDDPSKAALEKANTDIMAAEEALKGLTGSDAAALNTRLSTAEGTYKTAKSTYDGKVEMMAEEMTGRSLGLAKALRDVDPLDSDDVMAVVVENDESGKVSIEREDYKSEMGSSSGGWSSAMLMRSRTNDMQSMMVYTDVGKATRKDFGKVYGAAGADNPGGFGYVAEADDDNDATNRIVSIGDNGAVLTAAQGAFLDPKRFPQAEDGGSGDNAYNYSDKTAKNYKHGSTFTGKFNGAAGEYMCTAAATEECTVTVADKNAGGGYTLGGAWKFQHDPKATVVVQDTDYMTFGYWMQKPNKANAAGDYAGYMVSTFATGTPFPSGSINALMGTVKYKGLATGLYSTRTFEGGDIASAAHGSFMADAMLTADFGEDDTINGTTLGGKIDNFRGGEGMDDWSVTLSTTELTDAGAFVGAENTNDDATTYDDTQFGKTSAKIGDAPGSGVWTAMLYGDGVPSGAAPSGIAGTFDAQFTAAEIAGAFGATR